MFFCVLGCQFQIQSNHLKALTLMITLIQLHVMVALERFPMKGANGLLIFILRVIHLIIYDLILLINFIFS